MAQTIITILKNKFLNWLTLYQEIGKVIEYTGDGLVTIEGFPNAKKGDLVLIGPNKIKAAYHEVPAGKGEKALVIVCSNPADFDLIKCGDELVRSESKWMTFASCFVNCIKYNALNVGCPLLLLFLWIIVDAEDSKPAYVNKIFDWFNFKSPGVQWIFDWFNTKPPIIQNEIVPTITNTSVKPIEISFSQELPLDKKLDDGLTRDITIGTVAVVIVWFIIYVIDYKYFR